MAKKQNIFEDEIGNLGGVDDAEDFVLDEAQAAEDKIDHGVTGMMNTKIMTPQQRRKASYSEERIDRERVTGIGGNILENAEIRKGWIPMDRTLLGERDVFYPESWEFYIRPANVDAIKSWSTIDENNARSIDTVFNEMLKNCLSIKDSETGASISWSQVNNWDRFFFILVIHDYTFSKGESKIEFEEECDNCDAPIKFSLDTSSLYYDLPDKEVMRHWNREERVWEIDTDEYGLGKGLLRLYVPTLEKDANLLEYITDLYQTKGKFKRETEIFLKYLVWLLPKAPKDQNILKKKIRDAEMDFRGWSMDEFNFMDEVIRNIQVMPAQMLHTVCPSCGEEATANIQFPDGLRALFTMQSRYKKFGSK